MKRNLNLLAILVLMISCQKGVGDQQNKKDETEVQSALTKTTGASQYTYLSVKVIDAAGNEIMSDALGTTAPSLYVDGEQGVRAEFQHSNGDFYMMTNTLTAKTAKRFFKFPGNTDLENKNDYRIRIKDDKDLVAIQDMGVGSVPSSDEMVMRLWSFDSKGNLLFEMLFDPARYIKSVKVHVIRIDANTWEVVPVSPATATIRRANIEGVDDGPIPFKLILTRKS